MNKTNQPPDNFKNVLHFIKLAAHGNNISVSDVIEAWRVMELQRHNDLLERQFNSESLTDKFFAD